MTKRRKYRQQSKWWPWISFIVFVLIVILLGYSVVSKQSPATVLKSVFVSNPESKGTRGLSKDELKLIIEEQESKITQLQSELDDCQSTDVPKKGIISISSSTLNMRNAPSLESEVILKIPSGSTVSILYYDEQELILDGAIGQWCRIKYGNTEGWVWGNYVKE